MIVSNFFETDMFIPSEEIDAVELSENVDALALNYPDDWPGAYWYGWLRWENAADSLKISAVDLSTYSSNDFTRAFTGLQSPPQNFNVGYMSEGFSGYAQYWYGTVEPIQAFLDNGGVYHDPISDVSPFYGSRFINKLDPRGVCPIHGGAAAPIENGISIIIHLQKVLSSTDSCNNYTWDFVKFDGENEADGINKFLKGELTKTVTYSSFDVYDDSGSLVSSISINYTLDVNSPDFGVLYPNVWSTDLGDGYILNIFMCGYNYPVGLDRYNSEENYYYDTLKITPILSQNYNGVNYKTLGFTAYCNFLQYDDGVLTEFVWGSSPSMHSSTIIDSMTGLVIGGYKGTINSQPVNEHRYCMMFSAESNFAMVCDNLTRTRIFRILSPEEIMHSSTLNMRYVTNDDYTYSSYGFGAGMFYPHISPENEYLCEWLTGEFDDIKDDLRPWQYGDISDNEYNPTDLPPYEPPTPPLPDDKFSGDEIIPTLNLAAGTASDFITIYALTKTQISHIGSTLWSHIFDPDFRQSIGTIWAEDFTLDPAHIVDYITSMRMFPFGAEQMGNDFYTDTGNNLLYIGRGVTGLQVEGAHTFVVNYYSKSIYGGTVTVPFPYRDFKAYEPYSEVILHVPFCGSCALTPSEVMGENLSLTYIIDFSTGDVTAYCMVMSNVWKIVAVLTGKMGCEIQYTGGNFMQGMSNGLNAVIQAASNVAETAAGAYVPAMSSNESGSNIIHNATAKTGREIGDIGDAGGSYVGILNSMLSSKTPPTRATSKGFASLGQLVPYVEVTTKRFVIPNNFGEVCGFACNFSAVLKTLESTTGNNFTMCRNVKVDELSCTADEQLRIKQLLESGIFI